MFTWPTKLSLQSWLFEVNQRQKGTRLFLKQVQDGECKDALTIENDLCQPLLVILLLIAEITSFCRQTSPVFKNKK